MRQDESPSVNLQRFKILSAAYFGLLAVIAAIIIDTFLYIIGIAEILPIFESLILSAIFAAVFGALFAKNILETSSSNTWKIFGWGVLMTLIGIPLYVAGLIIMLYFDQPEAFISDALIKLANVYLVALVNLFVFLGWWLAILAGMAAVYLRKHLLYDILHSQNISRKLPLAKQTKMHWSKTPHRKNHKESS